MSKEDRDEQGGGVDFQTPGTLQPKERPQRLRPGRMLCSCACRTCS